MSVNDDLFNERDNDDDMVGDYNDNSDMDIDGNQDDDNQDNENDENEEEDDGDDDEENDNQDENQDDNQDDNDDEQDDDLEDNQDENQEENQDNQDKMDTDQGKNEKLGEEYRNGLADKPQENGEKKEGAEQKEPAAPLDTGAIRQNAVDAVRKAKFFDIVPSVAIPYAQQCHAFAVSDGPKWLLTGGEDGFIRKYDFAASVEGKSPLTVAQKHNLMDSITKAGVICSYWENEQPMTKKQILESNPKLKPNDFQNPASTYEPKACPVYALDVEKNGYWCLSGLLTGGISLYTMIYNEGTMHHYFRHSPKGSPHRIDTGHQDTISVLRLNFKQDRFLSGLWDKTIREWDLNTGKVVNLYQGSSGQVSNIQYRPRGLADILFAPEKQEQNSDVDSLFGDSDEEDGNTSKSSIKTERTDAEPSVKTKMATDDAIFMSSNIDGTINIWDARVSSSTSALKIGVPEGVPPWCMSSTWSNDGDKIYVGRRNSTVEELSIRMPHKRGPRSVAQPNVSKRLQFPKVSGPVSALSVMPNDNFILCGSNDNIRLYNLGLYNDFVQETSVSKKRATPFFVIPGHHGGMLSNLMVDDTGRFMISTSGNRGWGQSTYADAVLVYSIEPDVPETAS